MKTIREYADEKQVTYEAVRRQIHRYSKELKGHISIQNRTQYLDDWAIEFLSERRRQSPVVVIQEDQQEEIEKLKQQVAELQEKLSKATEQAMTSEKANMSYREKLITVQQENIELQKKTLLIEIIETQKNKAEEELEAVKTDLIRAMVQHEADQARLEELTQERDELKEEAGSYQRSIFGFYRKVK